MRAIVTGGAGFIGAHLCGRLLDDGYEVTALDDLSTGQADAVPSGVDLVFADISEPTTWARLRPAGIVFHLASPASPLAYQDTTKTFRANTDGTRLAAQYCRRHSAHMIYASSSEVYGLTKRHRSWREDDYVAPAAPSGRIAHHATPRAVYAYAKSLGEQRARGYGIARLFNVYGPGMKPGDGRVIPSFVEQLGNFQRLTVNGDGAQIRSFCHVTDAVRALVAMAERRVLGPLNIGNPEPVSVMQLAHMFGGQIGFVPGRSEDTAYRCPDISKAAEMLDWAPSIRLFDGISELVS